MLSNQRKAREHDPVANPSAVVGVSCLNTGVIKSSGPARCVCARLKGNEWLMQLSVFNKSSVLQSPGNPTASAPKTWTSSPEARSRGAPHVCSDF